MGSYRKVKTIELPGAPLAKFDISWVDAEARRYYFADRSNARVAAIDLERLEFAGAVGEGDFTGAPENGKAAGPNGVLVIPGRRELWAADGDSTVKVYSLPSGRLLQSVATGGELRCDELAYDEVNEIVLVANDAEKPPFVSLISARGDREILARIDFPRASNGMHQPVWDPATGLFYISVSEVDADPAQGEIAAIDGRTGKLVDAYAVERCQPAGLVMGPGRQLCVACGKDAVDRGFEPSTLVIDLGDRRTRRFAEVGGTDQVWYNPGDHRYYLAARAMTGGAVLGVIDADRLAWVENIPTSPDSHSVAADPVSNLVFLPLSPTADLPRGGVGVYAAEEGYA